MACQFRAMIKPKKKRPADPNQLAYSVVRDAVTETGKPAKKRKREKEQILKDEIGKDSVSNQC